MDKRNIDIVLVRMDKIGDLVLTLPVDEHPVLQGARVHWFISTGLGFVPTQAAPQRAFTEFKRSFLDFFRMLKWLKENRPRSIVILHAPWWVAMAAWWSEVPERIGRRSQWYSFLFLNLTMRQKRSLSDRHESDFNFDLVEWTFNKLGVRQAENLEKLKDTFLRLVPPSPMATVSSRGLPPHGYRVVHPGMAGSALNWPAEFYVELIDKLSREAPVVITGTKMDAAYLKGVESVREKPNVRWLVGDLKISELLDVLSQASGVVAPSTGVLHIAASLGTPSVGIYSPRKVEHPRRWGPRGPRVSALLPNVSDGSDARADVMREITPEQVYQRLTDLESGKNGASTRAHS